MSCEAAEKNDNWRAHRRKQLWTLIIIVVAVVFLSVAVIFLYSRESQKNVNRNEEYSDDYMEEDDDYDMYAEYSDEEL